MIKVLVVDDDKLVRKGLVATMPWSDFGMQVIGEANHGERALEMLAHSEVDLLMTDLVMPVMDGIELIRQMRVLYPNIWVVVLTFHQDFEYVQEALRLGAIDYIVKVQLENENADDVLRRIVSRIEHEQYKFGHTPSIPLGEEPAAAGGANSQDEVYFLVAAREANGQEDIFDRLSAQLGGLHPLGSGMWQMSSGRSSVEEGMHMFDAAGGNMPWVFIQLVGTKGIDVQQLSMKLRDYKEYRMFYEFAEGTLLYVVDLPAIRHAAAGLPEKEWERLGNLWSSLFWVTDESLYADLIAQVEKLKPPISMLQSLFYAAVAEWARIIPGAAIDAPPSLSSYAYWLDWRSWLDRVKRQLRSQFQKPYSEEVTRSIMKAVDYASRNLHQDVTVVEMAKEVHMSRSYFSECFKGVIGKSFHDYVRDMRLSRAMTLLQHTEHPIYQIAEQCGYPNERYFSRLFREHTGKLPSEYRSGIK